MTPSLKDRKGVSVERSGPRNEPGFRSSMLPSAGHVNQSKAAAKHHVSMASWEFWVPALDRYAAFEQKRSGLRQAMMGSSYRTCNFR